MPEMILRCLRVDDLDGRSYDDRLYVPGQWAYPMPDSNKHDIVDKRLSLTWHSLDTRPVLTFEVQESALAYALVKCELTLRRWWAAFWFRPWLACANVLEVVCPSSVDFNCCSKSLREDYGLPTIPISVVYEKGSTCLHGRA